MHRILSPDPSLDFEKNFAKREQLEENFASRTVSVLGARGNAEAQNSLPDAMLSRNFAEENFHENVPVAKVSSKHSGADSVENKIRSNDGSGLSFNKDLIEFYSQFVSINPTNKLKSESNDICTEISNYSHHLKKPNDR